MIQILYTVVGFPYAAFPLLSKYGIRRAESVWVLRRSNSTVGQACNCVH